MDDSNNSSEEFFVTQLYTTRSLDEYINDEAVEECYNNTISKFLPIKKAKLGSNGSGIDRNESRSKSSGNEASFQETKLEKNLRIMLGKYKNDLKPLIPILFIDCFNYFNGENNIEETLEKFEIWKHIYNKIYETTKSHMFFEAFIDILPYTLSFAITDFYRAINTQILNKYDIPISRGYELYVPEKHGTSLIQIPMREDICQRIVFLFTTITPLKSFIITKMNFLFGEDETPRPPPIVEKKEERVMLPIEDKDLFDEYAPRSMYSVSRFGVRSTSPALSSKMPDTKRKLPLNYPPEDDNFDTLTKEPTMKDSGARTFIKKALQLDVKAHLREVCRDSSLRTTKIIHKERQELNSIMNKRDIVMKSPEKKKDLFIKQMSENQKQGIYMEDPAVTLELLNSEEHKKILSRQLKKSKKSISIFVDQFISLSQVKVKNEEIDEIHLTPEMRHASLDSRELVK